MTKITNDFYPSKSKKAISILSRLLLLAFILFIGFPVVAQVSSAPAAVVSSTTVWDFGNPANATAYAGRAQTYLVANSWTGAAAETYPGIAGNGTVASSAVVNGLGLFSGTSTTNIFGLMAPTTGATSLWAAAGDSNYSSAFRFPTSGNSSAGTAQILPTQRTAYIDVTGPCTITIWFRTGGTGVRNMYLSDGTTQFTTAGSGTAVSGAGYIMNYNFSGVSTAPSPVTASVATPVRLYIFGDSNNGIIKLSLFYGTIWNGTSWTLGAPNSTVDAFIDGSYSTAANGAITAKKLTVNSLGSLTINSGTNVTVQNEVINNGTLTVENNANLIQVNSVTNTGNVVVKRNSSPLLLFDYTLWSSPVAGQNLAAFSPLTSLSPNRFYIYDSASDKYTNTVPVTLDPTTTNFTPGAGYLIRMPNTADAGTPTAYPGVFTGVPNNGDVPFTLSTAGGGYNLVGNPYPSPINMTQFVNDNSATITGTLYFWRKTNGLGTAYCTWAPAVTPPTGTFVTNGNLQSVDPLGVLQTGQGFFVQANNSGSITFKNGQRAANTAGQFFKTKQPATSSRIWLNATNTAGDFSQMAVTYFDGASQGVDIYDGKYINDSTFALTSNINGGEYTIQGRPAFDAADVVSLNFKTDVSGNYTIAIDHTDGLFASGQEVYLIDNKTGTETNLNTSAYTFTAAAGIDNTRFSLKYQKTLKVDAAAFNDNSVAVYKSSGTLYVNSALKAIDSIRVYDVQGRLIAEQNKVKANTATISNLKVNNQVLIVKVTGEDNSEVTKKVLN